MHSLFYQRAPAPGQFLALNADGQSVHTLFCSMYPNEVLSQDSNVGHSNVRSQQFGQTKTVEHLFLCSMCHGDFVVRKKIQFSGTLERVGSSYAPGFFWAGGGGGH